MWLLKNAGWLLIFAVAGWFGFENRNETVSNLHLAGRSYPQAPLVLVVFVTYILGMICAFILTLFHQLKVRSDMDRVNRMNKDLKRELNQLRNLSIDDLETGQRG